MAYARGTDAAGGGSNVNQAWVNQVAEQKRKQEEEWARQKEEERRQERVAEQSAWNNSYNDAEEQKQEQQAAKKQTQNQNQTLGNWANIINYSGQNSGVHAELGNNTSSNTSTSSSTSNKVGKNAGYSAYKDGQGEWYEVAAQVPTTSATNKNTSTVQTQTPATTYYQNAQVEAQKKAQEEAVRNANAQKQEQLAARAQVNNPVNTYNNSYNDANAQKQEQLAARQATNNPVNTSTTTQANNPVNTNNSYNNANAQKQEQLAAQKRAAEQAAAQKAAQEAARRAQEEAARQAELKRQQEEAVRQAEAQRQEQLRQRQLEAERQRQAELARQAELQRQAELERLRQEELARQAELQRQREEEERLRREAEERARIAAELEAERQRQEQIQQRNRRLETTAQTADEAKASGGNLVVPQNYTPTDSNSGTSAEQYGNPVNPATTGMSPEQLAWLASQEGQAALANQQAQAANDLALREAALRNNPFTNFRVGTPGEQRYDARLGMNQNTPKATGTTSAMDEWLNREYPEYEGEQPTLYGQRNSMADYYRSRELLQPQQPQATVAEQTSNARALGNILAGAPQEDETEFYSPEDYEFRTAGVNLNLNSGVKGDTVTVTEKPAPTSRYDPYSAIRRYRDINGVSDTAEQLYNIERNALNDVAELQDRMRPDVEAPDVVPLGSSSKRGTYPYARYGKGNTIANTGTPAATTPASTIAPAGFTSGIAPRWNGGQSSNTSTPQVSTLDELATVINNDPDLKPLYDQNVQNWIDSGWTPAEAAENALRNMAGQLGVTIPTGTTAQNNGNPLLKAFISDLDHAIETTLLGPFAANLPVSRYDQGKAIGNFIKNAGNGIGDFLSSNLKELTGNGSWKDKLGWDSDHVNLGAGAPENPVNPSTAGNSGTSTEPAKSYADVLADARAYETRSDMYTPAIRSSSGVGYTTKNPIGFTTDTAGNILYNPGVNQSTGDLALEASIRRGDTTYEQVYDDYVAKHKDAMGEEDARRLAYRKIYNLGYRPDPNDESSYMHYVKGMSEDFVNAMDKATGGYYTGGASYMDRYINGVAGGFDRSYDQDRLFYDLTSEMAGNAYANQHPELRQERIDNLKDILKGTKKGTDDYKELQELIERLEREKDTPYSTTPGFNFQNGSTDPSNPLNQNGALQGATSGLLTPDQILHFYDANYSDLVIPEEARKWMADDSTHALNQFFLNDGNNLSRLQKEHGTEDEYNAALRALINANPALRYMYDNGDLSMQDIAYNFTKARLDDTGGVDNPFASGSGSGATSNSPHPGYYEWNGKLYPIDQEKAKYYLRYGTYDGWDEGMRDYYNTFGTFYGYRPDWETAGGKNVWKANNKVWENYRRSSPSKSSSTNSKSTTPANTTPSNTTPSNNTPTNYTPTNTTPSNTTPSNNTPTNTTPTTDTTNPVNTYSGSRGGWSYGGYGNTYVNNYNGYGNGSSYSNGSRSEQAAVNPSAKNQKQNRIYNIMKNWSF